ncbi:MAG: CoA ester lyase [Betaproteobacteria bacterium]|nr:CoA ester lyase [Betaproteobacteria bacterium]
MIVRPRRSALYMPGSNARALDKARSLPADVLIFDLEDAVAPSAKSVARESVREATAAGGYGRRELLVRINGLDSDWGQPDIEAMAAADIDGIVIPKVENAAQIQAVAERLRRAGATGALPLWCMIETPRGVLSVEDIADASPQVAGLIMGTSDLSKELNATPDSTRWPLATSLGLCLLAAKAYGKIILDGVYLDLDDEPGFAAQCVQGRAFGFDGKTLIHPKTIDQANAVFGPTADEIAWARRVIATHAAAAQAGLGVVVVDGKLIENLHVAAAQRTVQLATAIAALEH